MTNEKTQEEAQKAFKASYENIVSLVNRLEHLNRCDGKNIREGVDDCLLSTEEIYDGLNIYFHEGDRATLKEREEYHNEETTREIIQETPLEIATNKEFNGTRGYMILLGTGGPATRIIGELNEHDEPETAKFQYQNWFTPWVNVEQTEAEENILIAFAREFYYEE